MTSLFSRALLVEYLLTGTETSIDSKAASSVAKTKKSNTFRIRSRNEFRLTSGWNFHLEFLLDRIRI